MDRKRKAAQREIIARRLESAFEDIYHNATLGCPRGLPADYSEYVHDDWDILSEHFGFILSEINDMRWGEPEHVEGYIAEKYGKVYTYGRGGATCAPDSWVKMHGGSSFNVYAPVTEDMGRPAMISLLLDVERWNEYVKAECSAEAVKDILMDAYDQAVESAKEALAARVEALVRI